MDDRDDRSDRIGTGADRRAGRADQLRIVGAEEAAARVGSRSSGSDELAPDDTDPRHDDHDDRDHSDDYDDDYEDDLDSLRTPRRRSAFDSIPDAPPSFLDDLEGEDDPTILAPPSMVPVEERGSRGRSRSHAEVAQAGDAGETGDAGEVGALPDRSDQPGLFGDDPTMVDVGAATYDNDDDEEDRFGRDAPDGYYEDGADTGPGGRAIVEAPEPDATAPLSAPLTASPAGSRSSRRRREDRPAAEHAGEMRPAAESSADETWSGGAAARAGRQGGSTGPGASGGPADPDPNRFGAVPVIRVGPVETEPGAEGLDLPHWTEPPTGQVPKVLVDEDRREDESWSTYGSAPRWRDPSSEWAASEYSDVSDLADDLPRVGALDEGERPSLDDFFSFEDIDSGAGRSERATGETASVGRQRRQTEARPGGGPPSGEHPVGGGDTGRDVPIAIGAGVSLAVLFVVLLRIGPAATLVLVTVAIAVAAAELMATTRRAGHHPAALVGLAAAAGLPLAVYWRGEAAYPLVLFLAVAFSLFWFLFGVDTERPAQNVGLTLLAVGYVGMFGSFAALMLRVPSPLGTNMLLAVTIPTVAADIGAFVVGRNAGRSPLTPISPSKTVEGALGGFAAAVTASVILNHFLLDLRPFDGLWDSAMLGVVVGIVSLLGDLCESLLKRSLGVKDMGTIIPGHGGVLDRVDALLFVLPTTYYLALLLDLIPA